MCFCWRNATISCFLANISINDVGPQWRSLGQALGIVESELDSSDISDKSGCQRCFDMLLKWLERGKSATYDDLGAALMDERVQRDDLSVKYCTGV